MERQRIFYENTSRMNQNKLMKIVRDSDSTEKLEDLRRDGVKDCTK